MVKVLDEAIEIVGVNKRHVTLHIDHHVGRQAQLGHGPCAPVGSRGQGGGGQDDLTPFRDDGISDAFVVRGNEGPRDPAGPLGTVQHMNDQRPTLEVGQRLAWEAGGGPACGDDCDAVHRAAVAVPPARGEGSPARDQRLLNWNFLRAPGWPYFFRSTFRASRVSRPWPLRMGR